LTRHLFSVACLTLIGIALLSAAPPSGRIPGRLLLGDRNGVDRNLIENTVRLHRAVERRHVADLGLHVIEVPEELTEATLQSLRQTGLFEYVERDYYAHTASDPNDPSYISQWHLRKIGGPQAWSVTTGSASVVVAVLDSGVYGDHPDLAGKLVPGWNFVKGNADTADVLGHGTAVAGTVAAATNNGIGVAGVNWASRVMPLVVVDRDDFAAYSDIAAAIQYAADRGVRVINVSVGGTNSSATLQKAVDYAWKKGALVFASAMNNSVSDPYYPAACTHAIAISATDANDRLAGFSNFGSWISLSAPGTGILTTANGGGYSYLSGTSFASPIAAGVAALILAADPSLTNDAVLALMKGTADRIGAEGFDNYFGWGRVNAFRAVLAAEPPRQRAGRREAPLPRPR
jgi:thermitase